MVCRHSIEIPRCGFAPAPSFMGTCLGPAASAGQFLHPPEWDAQGRGSAPRKAGNRLPCPGTAAGPLAV